jgi:O-antigen/teichoic acid export membrane protein
VNSALTRYLARLRAEDKPDLAASMLRSGYLFKLAVGLFASAICFIFADQFATYILNRPEMGYLVRVASILILFQSAFGALSSAFIGLERMEHRALVLNIMSIVKVVFSPLLIIVGFGVIGMLMGHISGYASASIVGSLILLKHYRKLGPPSCDSLQSNLKVMLRYGFPLYLSALIGLLSGQYRTIILAFFSSNIEIGNLNVAIKLASAVTILVFHFSVLFPAFSKVNSDSKELKRLFKISVKYTALLIVPASILIAIISEEFVYTFYGQNYTLAPSYLSIHILTFLYSGVGSMVLGHLFNGIGETKTILKANLLGIAVLIPLLPALTMLYGIPGLLIMTLLSALPPLIYQLYVAFTRFKLRLDIKSTLKIYLTSFTSAIPTLIFLQLSPFNGFLNLLFSCALYLFTFLTIVPLTKTLTEADLADLRVIMKRIHILRSLTEPVFKYEERIIKLVTKKV